MRKDDLSRRRNQGQPVLDVAVDVGLEEVHLVMDLGSGLMTRKVANRTEEQRAMCVWLRGIAAVRGFSAVRVIAEPTGIYHELLFEIVRQHGLEARLVQAEAVAGMRLVMFGDYGKTDARDPKPILELGRTGRLIRDRSLDSIFTALRRAGVLYARSESDGIRAKSRIHRAIRRVFPDFDFKSGFLYSASGSAVMQISGFDPHRIVTLGRRRLTVRLRRLAPRIQRRSIERLLATAELSAGSVPCSPARDLTLLELEQAWHDLRLAESRKAEASGHLVTLYRAARELDQNLPAPQKGLACELSLARLVAETGPWSHFSCFEQLFKYVGLNLYERQSGRFRGKTRISKKGRSLARHVLAQIVIPLVRKGRLFGEYYHHKRSVEKKPGPVAITAVARKVLKVLWGWGRSGQIFSPQRVFTCESQLQHAA